MRYRAFAVVSLLLSFLAVAPASYGAEPLKEWTFLVFLNGNNNLDSYGAMNLNQMEKVGSTDNLNVVVQWASLKNGKVQRLFVTRDDDTRNVTSPVVEDMGKVDMGDWRNLAEFVRWGARNFPAKHYFVDVWNHGSGWHGMFSSRSGTLRPTDISFDDLTGNSISTEQLGQAMAESARAIGHKVDVYGSDACLMAMAEIAAQMSDSVDVFVGSQELEPAEGWPYDDFLARLTRKGTSPVDAAKALVEEYDRAYSGGQYGNEQVTLSAYDLSEMESLSSSVASLGEQIRRLDAADKAKVKRAANDALAFFSSDYGDLSDFVTLLSRSRVAGLSDQSVQSVQTAVGRFVIANRVSRNYERAKGVSFWLPKSRYLLDPNLATYRRTQFDARTGWSQALQFIHAP